MLVAFSKPKLTMWFLSRSQYCRFSGLEKIRNQRISRLQLPYFGLNFCFSFPPQAHEYQMAFIELPNDVSDAN